MQCIQQHIKLKIKLTPIAMTDPTPFLSTDIALPEVPDEDDTPGRKRRADPGSFIAVLEALQIGETTSRCKQVAWYELSDSRTADERMPEERRKLHNSVSPQVAKLAKRTGRQFKVEVVDVFASGSVRLFLVAFVTRIA